MNSHPWSQSTGKIGAWSVLAVLVFAAVIRLVGVESWSLWEDEETTIFFSMNRELLFAKGAPLFFFFLDGVYDITGVSHAAGRILAGVFGLISIWLTYELLRRHVSREVGIVAGIFLTVCLGHVFWSQSIRYYTLLLSLEALTLITFFEGLERGQYWKLALTGVCYSLALLTHFTAFLLLPVMVGYLILVFVMRIAPSTYGWKSLLALVLPLLLGLFAIAPTFLEVRASGIDGAIPPMQDVLTLLLKFTGYFGVPMVGLAILSPCFFQRIPSRVFLLLLTTAFVPILEMVVLAKLNLAIAAWYYGFVAIIGMAGLAGIALVGLFQSRLRALGIAAGAAAALYYGVFLTLYYTTMEGDRPPWRDGVEYVQSATLDEDREGAGPQILATVPRVVAYYLGVDPAKTLYQTVVDPVPRRPPSTENAWPQWYVVKQSHVTEAYAEWYDANCELRSRSPAVTIWIDRSVLVYFCPGTGE